MVEDKRQGPKVAPGLQPSIMHLEFVSIKLIFCVRSLRPVSALAQLGL